MILFKCDVCENTEELKSNTLSLGKRADICNTCCGLLGKAADLLNVEGFIAQLNELHDKFFLKES